jgi:rhodanese-related sulfurtransferase
MLAKSSIRQFHLTGSNPLAIGWLGILIFLASSCDTRDSRTPEISAAEFLKSGESPNAVILDVRTKGEYDRGHLSNAILIDLYSPGAAEKLMELDKTKTYYVYCHSGIRSRSVVELMRNQGFLNSRNIRGGIISLSQAGASFTK